ncbi:Rv2231c family pyridoxal phosphate-dependent protein CobC [Corynebacterium pseudotuberculosis]|uniref:Aminotransferase n=1 Tax=Corynebacterium pseudotuberculosis 258 TaxID=1168865 RepID=A0AAU8QEH2_CORPS|nr:Rv2231c family pyridoxal phosphate-dependent protein CobC [Corynebacterium pseudotuberculosis]AEQ07028.2 threonine-phosphate decarboxylase [Corynebacterium pseudotuberculosis CIP 52.97]AFB72833.1 threonine-phosphate decarboxylase [Corynebacterium pseudotuberculosis 316]AFK17122.1 threonine-phosphate decarboxylase [Corynebacterium pseudotuberculosis 258]AKS13819.1 Cobalamin-biosynthesis related aminotransferase [Corynebacterium pseudotuberculosis]AMN70380.1 threonine-phosphate decarboxylase 
MLPRSPHALARPAAQQESSAHAVPPLSRLHGDIDARGARLDFAVNVAEPTPPEWLVADLTAELSHLAGYPHAEQDAAARQKIAQYHGISPDHVLILCGASEGFSMLPKLNPAKAALIHPSFSEPDLVLFHAGVEIQRIVLPEPFTLDNVFSSETTGATELDMVVIGNPTNPTGVIHSCEQLGELRSHGRYLVVDEAFMDIVGETESMIGAGKAGDPHSGFDDVIVLRSLTKTWSIAGLRVGYLVASPAVIHKLTQGRAHWPVGSLAFRAIQSIMTTGAEQLEALRTAVTRHREDMVEQLEQAGFRLVVPSAAPFILVQPPEEMRGDAEHMRRQLLSHGIAVRRCDTFPGLDSSYWRLAVRSREYVSELITKLQQIGVDPK